MIIFVFWPREMRVYICVAKSKGSDLRADLYWSHRLPCGTSHTTIEGLHRSGAPYIHTYSFPVGGSNAP